MRWVLLARGGVDHGLPFISGLPRSGSTLLAALLLQNPAVRAGTTSHLGSMVGALLADMSQDNETPSFVDEGKRKALLRALFNTYHADVHPIRTVFDTNRGWTARLDLLVQLFPPAKVICCVRPVPWIIDSIERPIRRNSFELSKVFGFDRSGTVYSRAGGLMAANGLIG